MSSNNEVLGTFGMYFSEPHLPTKEEIEILKEMPTLLQSQ
jgi:hypothetical protein